MLAHLLNNLLHCMVNFPYTHLPTAFVRILLAKFPCPHGPELEVQPVVASKSVRIWASPAIMTLFAWWKWFTYAGWVSFNQRAIMLIPIVSFSKFDMLREPICALVVWNIQIASLERGILELRANICICIGKTDRLVTVWISSLISPLVPWV